MVLRGCIIKRFNLLSLISFLISFLESIFGERPTFDHGSEPIPIGSVNRWESVKSSSHGLD
jgi:hypothetical protein